MEVTRQNFEDVFDSVVRAIEESDFLSIDCEFTGINNDKRFNGNPFDTPEERFNKLYQGSRDFLVIQFGLCTFKYEEEKERYEARPYNFYVFPKPMLSQAPDNRFMCQSSSIEFLVKQGFNFDKLFRQGIPYLTQQQEQELTDQLISKHDQDDFDTSANFTSPEGTPQAKSVTVPDDQKVFINDVCLSIDELIENPCRKCIQLAPCTGYQRKLIYEVVKSRFSSLLHLQTKSNEKNERYIEVSLAESEEDLKKRKQKEQDAELADVNQAAGLSRLFRVISHSGKLIVGHNMLLDIVHLTHQFFLPLPPIYSDFKAAVHCIFPRLLDTKLMASTHPFKDSISGTNLGALHEHLKSKPFTQPAIYMSEEFSAYGTADHFLHEAGYDAYITGTCLLALKEYLGSFQKQAHIPATSSLLQPFLNKLFLMRVIDVPYINIVGEDLNPSRRHVFHVTFPRTWKTQDLHQIFSVYGNIQIGWINETSAYVGLYRKENAQLVCRNLCMSESSAYKVTPYAKYRSLSPACNVRKRSIHSHDWDLSHKRPRSLNAEASPFVVPAGVEPLANNGENNEEIKEISQNEKDTHDKIFVEPTDW